MKSKNINTFIIEGVDGVGKTTLYKNLLEAFNYIFPVYDRGELSNFVYAKKFNRCFSSSQRGFPILYILLYCDKEVLTKRIIKRANDENWKKEDLKNELLKISDQDIFLKYYNDFAKDYHIIKIDTSNLSIKETARYAEIKIRQYLCKLNIDSESTFSQWNKIYSNECKKLGLNYKVIDNQPYINELPIMAECNLHNGLYETFTDKRIPHNLIYCQYYNQYPLLTKTIMRKEDFSYIINNKIFTKHKVYNYFNTFVENGLTCLTGETVYSKNDPFIKCCNRVFGDDYIQLISKAKATIYIGRRLEYLKYLSTRLYESIIAQQVIFVDELSDLDCDILKQIHGKDSKLIELLTVNEKNIADKYNFIFNDSNLVYQIIDNQNNYYKNLKNNILNKIKETQRIGDNL